MGQQHTPVQLAKFLDYILGRRPDEFGLVPDGEGYVKIKDLLKVMHEEAGWGYVRQGALQEVVGRLPDAPIEMDGSRIRAVQRELLPEPAAPESLPKLLFTAVRERAHRAVLENGITPLGGFSHVVMASDQDLAERIGHRIDPDPVLLTVQVAWATQRGVEFQQFGEKLFLAESIPVGAFMAPPLPKEKADDAKARVEAPPTKPKTPGSFTIDPFDIEEKASMRRERKKKEIRREKERRQMRKQKDKGWE